MYEVTVAGKGITEQAALAEITKLIAKGCEAFPTINARRVTGKLGQNGERIEVVAEVTEQTIRFIGLPRLHEVRFPFDKDKSMVEQAEVLLSMNGYIHHVVSVDVIVDCGQYTSYKLRAAAK